MRPVTEPYSYAERVRAALPLEDAQWIGLRDAWSALWRSRLLVWAAGLVALYAAGMADEPSSRLDPFWFTIPFDDTLGNALVAPGARWDSAWFLEIAQFGYADTSRAAFFPLYPALVSLGGSLGSPLIAGVLISSACSLGALYLLHRLVALDFGRDDARATVLIVAFFPSALVLSAVYSEALFLVVSIGSLYAARLGRWPVAGLVGGLAAATRSPGVLLIVPLLVFYLCGPRADRPRHGLDHGWRLRHRVARDVLWIALVPAGLAVYALYLALTTGDPGAAFSAQAEWERIFAPLSGIALGLWSAVKGVLELLPGIGVAPSWFPADQVPELVAARDVILFGFLVLAVWLTVEASQRLPPPYVAYAITGLVLPLSVPALDEPLKSLPRFMLVLFPLWIALALWARERGWLRGVLVAMGTLLAVSSALFTTWVYPP
jgi:hypothetical protein